MSDEDYERVVRKMSNILTATANELKGQPEPLNSASNRSASAGALALR